MSGSVLFLSSKLTVPTRVSFFNLARPPTPTPLPFPLLSSSSRPCLANPLQGGENVNEFMNQSKAKIHVSRQHEIFPGTRDRICTVSALPPNGMNSILVGLHLILSKIRSEDTYQSFQFKLIMPAQGCGAIIGRGGVNIKAIIEETGCSMKVSEQGQMPLAMPFRLLTISGSIDQQIKAVALCFDVLSKNFHHDYLSQIKDFHGVDASSAHHLPLGHPGPVPWGGSGLTRHESSPLPGLPQVTATLVTTCVIRLPDEYVGPIIGKGGSVVQGIMNQSGCHVKISDKVAGSAEPRTVTITGSEAVVTRAYHLIAELLVKNLNNSGNSNNSNNNNNSSSSF